MAKVGQLNQDGWDKWVATCPPIVQELCRKYPPDRLYRMKSTGQRVTLLAYSEDGTVRVDIRGDFNALAFDRSVFGVSANDLEECDLPGVDEVTGTMLTDPKHVDTFIEMLREMGGFTRATSECNNWELLAPIMEEERIAAVAKLFSVSTWGPSQTGAAQCQESPYQNNYQDGRQSAGPEQSLFGLIHDHGKVTKS